MVDTLVFQQISRVMDKFSKTNLWYENNQKHQYSCFSHNMGCFSFIQCLPDGILKKAQSSHLPSEYVPTPWSNSRRMSLKAYCTSNIPLDQTRQKFENFFAIEIPMQRFKYSIFLPKILVFPSHFHSLYGTTNSWKILILENESLLPIQSSYMNSHFHISSRILVTFPVIPNCSQKFNTPTFFPGNKNVPSINCHSMSLYLSCFSYGMGILLIIFLLYGTSKSWKTANCLLSISIATPCFFKDHFPYLV